jgi:hypothetical protein
LGVFLEGKELTDVLAKGTKELAGSENIRQPKAVRAYGSATATTATMAATAANFGSDDDGGRRRRRNRVPAIFEI